MPPLVDWATAVKYMGGDESRLTQCFKGDTTGAHPNFDSAISVADGMMRTKIGERYETTKYDALLIGTAPDYMKRHQFALALSHATMFDDGRPDSINKAAGIAAGWLDDVVGSKARIVELEDVPAADLSTARGVKRRNEESRVFNPSAKTGSSTSQRILKDIDPDF